MGNIDSLRDWGHAKDYVKMQWMMLQQKEPQDFVIATGVQHTVREFIQWSALELGIFLRFEGSGIDEVAIVDSLSGCDNVGVDVGDVIMKIDPRYFRPSEVESLLGDPSFAKKQLGWTPEISAQEMCTEMVRMDLIEAKKHALLKANGFASPLGAE
jgi:GDPmannose 4,6-dehydratase